jgi:hypothetical protein
LAENHEPVITTNEGHRWTHYLIRFEARGVNSHKFST